MYKRIYFLVVKELITVWKDKRSRLVLILPPLFQLFIFAFAATLDVKNISIGILNKDYGKQSYELVQRFQGSSYFSKVKYLDSEKEMKSYVDNQKAIMVVNIDQTFSRKIMANETAEVQLVLDGRKSNTAQIVQGYAQKIIEQYVVDLTAEINQKKPPSLLIPRYWFNDNIIYLWFTVPGLVALLTMFTGLIVTSLSIARERELGTFDQLLVSPLTSTDILIGKAIPGIIIGMAEGIMMLLAAIFVFQIPFTGSIILLYISLFVFVCSIIGIGLFLSSLCKTQQQALLATFVFMATAVILSGFATPIENMPVWLQQVTYINPLRFALVIVRGLFLKNFPLKDVINNLYPIVIVAVINLGIAGWFFRKRME